MPATSSAPPSDKLGSGEPALVLCNEVFERITAQLGCRTHEERAAAAGVHVRTYLRWRKGHVIPSLPRALALVDRLEAATGKRVDLKKLFIAKVESDVAA